MGGRRGRGRGGCSREPGPGVAPRSWGPRALRPGEVAAAGRAALWRARVPPQAARRRGPAQASANPPLSAGPRPPHMAGSARAGFPAHTNSRLDAFLRRRLPPEVYDAIRAYEPCIVVSDSEKHTFKYVVLSDRLIYLTENPPKSIRRAVALRDVVAIDLVRSAGGQAGSRESLLGYLPPRFQACLTKEEGGEGRPSLSPSGLPYFSLTYFGTSSHTGKRWIAVWTPNKNALPILIVCTGQPLYPQIGIQV